MNGRRAALLAAIAITTALFVSGCGSWFPAPPTPRVGPPAKPADDKPAVPGKPTDAPGKPDVPKPSPQVGKPADVPTVAVGKPEVPKPSPPAGKPEEKPGAPAAKPDEKPGAAAGKPGGTPGAPVGKPGEVPTVAAGKPSAGASSTEGECRILTSADIRAITGVDVRPIARGAVAGAGGTCGNYATQDGQAYLGVNALASNTEYSMTVSTIPRSVFQAEERIEGLGDEAVLFKDNAQQPNARFLVARKGSGGVVLIPLVSSLTDEQLKQLAAKALSAV